MGILHIQFKNGSHGIFRCYPSGILHTINEITTENIRCLIHEEKKKAWLWSREQQADWEFFEAKIPYTSELTTIITEEILIKGSCSLIQYKESMKLHLNLFEPILKFINKISDKIYTTYPFT